MRPKRFISVDPGVSGTGYAIWSRTNRIIDFGIIAPPSTIKEFEARVMNIERRLRNVVRTYKVEKSYIEFPAFYQGFGGQVTARSGALVKLAFTVGILYGALPECHLVPVSSWKGSLPKEIVIQRIRKILPKTDWMDFKEHVWDACGIGLHVQGRF